ncbi:MAG: HAD family hydrolase [Thermoflavifilum sp.]|nr:HAD family hydrolase [Thermoflavifilum sp.]MCL6514621.1 HAD family hydrolase [Alicyclobacillus sp.]
MSDRPLPPAVILDRDGVINDNDEPVNGPEQLRLYPWAAAAIRRLNEAGYRVMVATNQGGVGLGYMSAQDLDAVHERLSALLKEEGAVIEAYAACTHPPQAGCDCRKPRPGLIHKLWEVIPFDKSRSFMVGDRESDVEAALAAGLRAIRIGPPSEGTRAERSVANLREAVDYIMQTSRDDFSPHTMGAKTPRETFRGGGNDDARPCPVHMG